MAYNKNINNPKFPITPQQILSSKYFKTNDDYNQMKVDLLINSHPSHYNAIYRDYFIWDSPYTYFERYYKIAKSLIKIPMKAIYYKNYLLFFSRPFIWDLRLDKVIQIFINKKAKIFYKQVYGSIHQSRREEATEQIGTVVKSPSGEIEDLNENKLKIVFDTSARNTIDNQILTTIDIGNNQEDNIVKTNEEFFTLDTFNDFFVDLVYNITKTKNERKKHRFNLKSQLFLLTPTSNTNGNKNNPIRTKNDEKRNKQSNTNINININSNYDYNIKIPLKKKNSHIKSSYCTLYKAKPNSSGSRSKSKNDANKVVNYSSNNRNEGKIFQLHSPNYQINTNYSEFKKYNQSKSKSNSKSKPQSIASKSNVNERLKPQYTSYIKTTSYYKNSMDKSNKTLLKSPTNTIKAHISIEEHYTKSTTLNKSKCNNYHNNNTNTNSNTQVNINTYHIPKAKNYPAANRNLLLNYLNNCSNSRQTKQKIDSSSYFSMRNLSHEKSFPIQSAKAISSHKTSYQPNRHQINNSNANSNRNIFNTAQNVQSNTNNKNKICVNSMKNLKQMNNDCIDNQFHITIDHKYRMISHTNNNSKENILLIQKANANSKSKYNATINNPNAIINVNKMNPNVSTRTPTVSSLNNNKGSFCRNPSHLNVLNDKGKNTSIAVIEKLIKGIKKNLNSNSANNDISMGGKNNKSTKSTKHNDTTQTSSNTHQGHAHSKSPQLIEFGKNDPNTNTHGNNTNTNSIINTTNNNNSNNNSIIRKTNKLKHEKENQIMFPDNKMNKFLSQRKGV